MPRVVVKENEDLDSALRRFKRQVNNSGVLAKCRAKEFYVKPGVARRLKSEAARKKASQPWTPCGMSFRTGSTIPGKIRPQLQD